ncbi:MAG TPA: class I SAM-dependent methyltransferase family protein [Gemmatimonadota bacterium]|nr:class I SAM-dependent methyltransferase family protein [Gemmatimonadota bacterium]
MTRALVNRTRTSPSIARRLLREGKLHLLPLYALTRTSDLAREGIENSGSYRFADHAYRARPSGRYLVGKFLDRVLLGLRGARSMRSRFLHAKAETLAAARRHPAGRPFRALSVPCGVARELVEVAATLRAEDPGFLERATFFGMDLDPRPLDLSRELAAGVTDLVLIEADAFDRAAYPSELDVVLSTGFGEFLSDEELTRFYAICRDALREGGVFVTSGMQRDRVADYLMRELAELEAHYRGPATLLRRLQDAGFSDVSARQDDVGLQTLLVARKGAAP